jgi:hypothetical protein
MSEEVAAEAVVEESAPIQEESAEVSQEVSEEVSEPISESAPEVQAETEAELEDEIQAAAEDGATEEEIKDMIRQYTIKVDGKELVREIDVNNEEEMIRQLQLAAKGQKSTQELAELKKTYNAGLQNILNDPFAALKSLDPDFDEMAYVTDFVNKRHAAAQMSPEEKAAAERDIELEQLRAERDRMAQEKQEREQSEQRKQLADEIQTDIMAALDSDDELIADRETIGLIANELMWAVKNGYDMTAKDVLPTVKDQLKQQYEKAAGRFKSTDVLKKYLGKNLIEKLREERVQQAKEQVKSVKSINKDVASKPADEEANKAPGRKLSELFR